MAGQDKKKMVDYPDYTPGKRVPFPPGPGSPFGQSPPKKKPEPEAAPPFYERYDPDPTAPVPGPAQPQADDPGTDPKK